MKILVSDFDKTFFTDDIKLNVELVNKFMDEGNKFIIATGRPLYLLKPELKKYSIKYNYLICNDGAVIFDSEDNIIDKTNIEHFQAIEIFNFLKRSNAFEHVYIDNIYDFGELDSKDYNGILALPYDRNKALDVLEDIRNKYFNVNAYLSHRWLNILSVDVSKGIAIKFLCDKENWPNQDIYTIGDGLNDMSMTTFENCYAVNDSNNEFRDKCNNVIDKFSSIFKEMKK